MKKKYLLGIIPALLALSACNNGGTQKEEKQLGDDLLEDTLAHEEIFGNVEEGLAPRKLSGKGFGSLRFEDPVLSPELDPTDTSVHPAIGVQSFYDSVNNKVSFRFVAAVHFDDAEARIGTTARWPRSVSKADGTAYPKDGTGENPTNPNPVCTTAYKKLSNDGGAYTIEQFNSEHGGTEYTHFVVYTLRDIDLSTYTGSDYYVSAYLSLSGSVGDVSSKAIAIRFDRDVKYSYNPLLGEYVLFGSVGGNPYVKKADVVRSSLGDTDVAKFNNLAFSDGDSFLIREFYDTKVYIKKPKLEGEGNAVGYWFNADGSSIEANYNGIYNLSYNNSSQLWVGSASNVVSGGELYIDVNVSWWGNDSAWTSVYVYDGTLASGHGKWFALTGTFWGNTFRTHTEDAVFTSTSYAAGYKKAVVCRLKNGTNLPADRTEWDTSIIHNQYDLTLKTNGLEDCIFLYNNVEYSMGKR